MGKESLNAGNVDIKFYKDLRRPGLMAVYINGEELHCTTDEEQRFAVLVAYLYQQNKTNQDNRFLFVDEALRILFNINTANPDTSAYTYGLEKLEEIYTNINTELIKEKMPLTLQLIQENYGTVGYALIDYNE